MISDACRIFWLPLVSEDVPDVVVEVPGVLRAQPAGEGEVAVVGPDMSNLGLSRHLLPAVLAGPAELPNITAGARAGLRLLTALRLRQRQGVSPESPERRHSRLAAD